MKLLYSFILFPQNTLTTAIRFDYFTISPLFPIIYHLKFKY